MNVTVKLDAALEERLRQRAAASGRSTSDVVRAAIGSASLAQNRKAELTEIWADKHRTRQS